MITRPQLASISGLAAALALAAPASARLEGFDSFRLTSAVPDVIQIGEPIIYGEGNVITPDLGVVLTPSSELAGHPVSLIADRNFGHDPADAWITATGDGESLTISWPEDAPLWADYIRLFAPYEPSGRNLYDFQFLRFGNVVASGRIDARNGGFGFVALGATALPPVPEPANWALLIAGFGLVGGALRRRSEGGTPLRP